MGVRGWLFSSKGKDIGSLYLVFGMFSGLVGRGLCVVIRLELGGGGVELLNGNKDLLNVIIRCDGLVMILLMVMGGLMGGFGVEVGGGDMGLGRLNKI
ncbi:hypothetical protein E3Q02_04458 [Wallemia mellicola]|uniref:Cytochrome c oxidase subunit 1 n=1 Tax=Wallemia mellicola TaxID=1708541 RepID=A0AB38MPK2_9BASI|nr:hypothetical protein E3Q02_04458 [Wallemia mellicola]